MKYRWQGETFGDSSPVYIKRIWVPSCLAFESNEAGVDVSFFILMFFWFDSDTNYSAKAERYFAKESVTLSGQ